jgi:hypothetical protein
MIQSKLFPFSLVLLALPITFPKVAQAQFITPYNGGPCGLGNCRNGGNGTYIQKKSGDVYDRKGNLLRSGNGESDSTPSPSPSSTSQLTPERIRAYANEPGPFRGGFWRASICYNKEETIDGHRLSPSEMNILLEELKC